MSGCEEELAMASLWCMMFVESLGLTISMIHFPGPCATGLHAAQEYVDSQWGAERGRKNGEQRDRSVALWLCPGFLEVICSVRRQLA